VRGIFRSILIMVVPQSSSFINRAQEFFKESAEERAIFVFVNAALFDFSLIKERRNVFVCLREGC
jgi:hypothetical protein